MTRAVTKCSLCGGVMWISDTDPAPQACVCLCGATELREDGPVGYWVEPSEEELTSIT